MKYHLRLYVAILLALLAAGAADGFSQSRGIRPAEQKPRWWLEDGICFVGHWEPLAFHIRRGRVARDYREHYEWQHELETVRSLREAGVNTIITHFYKGLGLEHEAADLEYTRRQVDNLRKLGMYAGGYVGSTLFSETLYNEVPGSAGWVQLDREGEPIIYSDQYFRERADFTHQGYRDQIKKVVRLGIEQYDLDLIHFDNFYTMFPLEAGHTEHIQQLFREYLESKYTPGEREMRIGFADVGGIRPPRVANRPMDPVNDPVVQEWILFRVEALTDFFRELSEHIRGLDPETVVEFNPHGIWGQNNAYSNGMDHARLLPLSDIFWSEDPDHAEYFPEQNRLVSKIRSYKLARRFGNALFSYNNRPLELAEALAFNRMCLGDVQWELGAKPESLQTNLSLISFFHENKELYRDLETIADVGVMRDFESMVFGGWVPFLTTVQAEQALIQTRTPFTLLFDRDWERLADYEVVVLGAQENLTDEEIGRLAAYVRGGGALMVVGGTTGAFDGWRRDREDEDEFWRMLGAPRVAESPREPARFSMGSGRVCYIPEFEEHPGVPATAREVHPDYWYLPLNHEQFMDGLYWCRGGDFSVTVETKPWVVANHYRKAGQRQAHLVNYRPGGTVRHVPVAVREPGFRPRRARYLSPGREPVELELGRYGDGWLTMVPELDLYGIVVLE